jgi:hypothetical protein
VSTVQSATSQPQPDPTMADPGEDMVIPTEWMPFADAVVKIQVDPHRVEFIYDNDYAEYLGALEDAFFRVR